MNDLIVAILEFGFCIAVIVLIILFIYNFFFSLIPEIEQRLADIISKL